MGYESVETDSLITLKIALGAYRTIRVNLGQSHMQNYKDATYELDRITSELNNR